MSDPNTALAVQNLTRTYTSGGHPLTVLNDVTFSIPEGQSCAVVGPSGSGKTTLLGLCAGLDRPTSGTVTLHDLSIDILDEDQRAAVRNEHVGFVFQSFQLIPTLTAIENVMVPLELRGETNIGDYAKELLDRVGLVDRLTHYPTQLSGGEQQRVAIARAFINRPRILFADEPTGNLDADTSHTIVDLLFLSISDGSGGAYIVFVMVFSNEDVDVYAQRVDANGNLNWSQPIAVIESPDQDRVPIIVVAEIAPQNGDVDVYAQRIDNNGNLRWNNGDPVPVIESPDPDRVPTAVADGSGGAIVVTEIAFRSGQCAGDADVYAQRIDNNGNLVWNNGDPIPVIESPDVDRVPVAVSDGSGGAIVVTEMAFLTGQFAGDVDVYAQRIDNNGNSRWNGGDLQTQRSPYACARSTQCDRLPLRSTPIL